MLMVENILLLILLIKLANRDKKALFLILMIIITLKY